MTEREIWAYQNIANAVIVNAVSEWRRIIRLDPNSGRLDELRQFFQGEWCALLCGQVDPALILERLEEEREV